MMSGTEVSETGEKNEATGTADDSSSSNQGFKRLRDKIIQIPCMRSSLLNGYVGAVVGGLAGFFYTSKIKMGLHCSMASYWIVATGSWVTCRYKLNKDKMVWENLFKKVKEKNIKKDEYNIPVGVTKLNNETGGGSDNIPVKDS